MTKAVLLKKGKIPRAFSANTSEEHKERRENGKMYFVSIASDTKCWLKTPATTPKEYTYKDETHAKIVLRDTTKQPIAVQKIASNLNDYFWYRRKVSEGTKGPIEYEFSRMRVTLSKDGLPWKIVWLIIKRTIGKNPTYSFFISNAPGNIRLPVFVWLCGIRWAIEQCFEEGKTELGMDHCELWHLKIRLGGRISIC